MNAYIPKKNRPISQMASINGVLSDYKEGFEVPSRPPLVTVLKALEPLYNGPRTQAEEEKFTLLNKFRQEYYE